jgi:thiamine-phosphate pyrophosphorylase
VPAVGRACSDTKTFGLGESGCLSDVRKPDKALVCYVTDRKPLAHAAPNDPIAALVEKIRMAVDAGVDWIQIREKDLPGGRLLSLVCEAVASVRGAGMSSDGARIFVNDRLDVALAAGAAGVHLGGESLPVAEVVRWCRAGNAPAEFQIGVSTHSIEQAREAERDGADYIFFGPIFDTPSKRSFGPPQGIERLGEVCRGLSIPVIAIGGINESNAADCIRAGASGIAAIRLFQGSADAGTLAKTISRMRATDCRG